MTMLLAATAPSSSLVEHHHHHLPHTTTSNHLEEEETPSTIPSSPSDLICDPVPLKNEGTAVELKKNFPTRASSYREGQVVKSTLSSEYQRQHRLQHHEAASAIITRSASSSSGMSSDDDYDDDTSASSSKLDEASPLSPTSCKELVHSCYSNIFSPVLDTPHSFQTTAAAATADVDSYTASTAAAVVSPPVLASLSSHPALLQPQQRPITQLRSVLRRCRHSHVVGMSSAITTPAIKSLRGGPQYKSKRRVRGLWEGESNNNNNNNNINIDYASMQPSEVKDDLFAQLYNEQLHQILSFLPMSDILNMARVSQRWKYVAVKKDDPGSSSSAQSCWNHIDATDFVHQTYKRNLESHNIMSEDDAAKATSLALGKVLQDRTPILLTIQNIEHRLRPDIFLPSRIHRLQQLTLTQFIQLTDTHVHVLFLSSSSASMIQKATPVAAVTTCQKKKISSTAAGGRLPLSRLILDGCPILTNACLLSIALHCPNLQHLSLRGNQRMDSLVALKDCWKVVVGEKEDETALPSSTHLTTATSTPELSTDCAAFLFMPLPPKVPPTLSATSPPLSLKSLFAQPPPPLHLRPKLSIQTSSAPTTSSSTGTRGNDLSYLFSPPTGTSPKRPPPAPITLNGRQRSASFSVSSSAATASAAGGGGKLTSIDLSFTKIGDTPCLLLESLRAVVAASDELGKKTTQQALMKTRTAATATYMPPIPVLDSNESILPPLCSLFAPPPSVPASALGGLFAPPPALSALGSMFAPLPSRQSGNNSKVTVGSISKTTESGDPPRRRVALESLKMCGCGESWRDDDLVQLGDMISAYHLKAFDLSCGDLSGSRSQIIGHGLEALLLADDNNRSNKKGGFKLERLDLAGHDTLSARSLARVVSHNADTLTHLNVHGCKGLFGSSDHTDNKLSPLGMRSAAVTFTSALDKATKLESLSLAHCVPFRNFANDEVKPGSEDEYKQHVNSNDDNDDTVVMTTSKLYLDTFANSPLRLTLRVLDLRGWWFVTSFDVATIRKACPRLQTLLCDI